MSNPDITACICSLDRAAGLGTAFRSLTVQRVDKSRVELLIVDNGSTLHDAVAVGSELVAEARSQGFKAVQVVESKMGLAHARNRALQEANGSWIAFMDDDEAADPQWLSTILATVDEQNDPKLGCLGGPMLLDWPNDTRPRWFSAPLAGFFSGLDLGPEERDLNPRVDLLFGGNLIVRRDAVIELGGFAVNLGRSGHESLLGSEDTLIQLTLANNNYRVRYVPHAIINHVILTERLEAAWILKRSFGQGVSETRLRKIVYGHSAFRHAVSALRDWVRRRRQLRSYAGNSNGEAWTSDQISMLRSVNLARLKGTISALFLGYS